MMIWDLIVAAFPDWKASHKNFRREKAVTGILQQEDRYWVVYLCKVYGDNSISVQLYPGSLWYSPSLKGKLGPSLYQGFIENEAQTLEMIREWTEILSQNPNLLVVRNEAERGALSLLSLLHNQQFNLAKIVDQLADFRWENAQNARQSAIDLLHTWNK